MTAETCPLCSTALVQREVAPCMACGHHPEELQHLAEGRHTYADYCIFWPLSLVLCDYCQEHFEEFNPEWFGLPLTADIGPERISLVREVIPPSSPGLDWVCVQCSGTLSFLQFVKDARDLHKSQELSVGSQVPPAAEIVVSAEQQAADTAEAVRGIAGTWYYPRHDESRDSAWLHFADDGRLLEWVHDSRGPNLDKCFQTCIWYAVESSTRFTVQIRKRPDISPRDYSLQGDTLIIGNLQHRFFCTRARSEEVPAWVAERMARALAETWERLSSKDSA